MHETSPQRALHCLFPQDFDLREEVIMSAVSATALPPTRDRNREPLTVTPEELARLRRLVQLATTTIGELNLWLANAGRPIQEEDR